MNVSEDLTLLPALRLFTESWWRRQHPWLAEKGYKIIPSQSLSADSDEFSLETVTESDLGSFEIVISLPPPRVSITYAQLGR